MADGGGMVKRDQFLRESQLYFWGISKHPQSDALAWRPNVSVSAVVETDGRFLLLEKMMPVGRRLALPATDLQPGESLIRSAQRIVRRVTGATFAPKCLLVTRSAKNPRNADLSLHFAFGGALLCTPDIVEVDTTNGVSRWLSADEALGRRQPSDYQTPTLRPLGDYLLRRWVPISPLCERIWEAVPSAAELTRIGNDNSGDAR